MNGTPKVSPKNRNKRNGMDNPNGNRMNLSIQYTPI
jgi:hypothetical protein